jgi:hypothetical protein
MKKILTLLFASGLFFMAEAQPGNRDFRQPDQRNDQQNNQQSDQRNFPQNDQRGYQQNDQRDFNNGYDKSRDPSFNNPYDRDVRYDDRFSMERRLKMEIARINQDYDFKIEKVRCNIFLSWWDKQSQIRYLEQQRQWEISNAYARFSYRGRYDDRNSCHNRDDRFERHDRSFGHY